MTSILVGCSSSDDTGTTSSSSGTVAATGCAADSRKDIFTKGIAKPAGALSVHILDSTLTVNSQSTPSTVGKGTNEMTIEVMDAAGAPIDGATITVTPFMPDHGHGSAVKPIVTAEGAGKYKVAKVYLAMAGLWRITVSVQQSSGTIDEAAFQFCLDG